MNVGQLIEKLKEFPPEEEIYTKDSSYGLDPVDDVWHYNSGDYMKSQDDGKLVVG